MENKRHSIRLYHRNYSQPGYYFVTIDTDKHEFLCGDIENNTFIPNSTGLIIQKWIGHLPIHYPQIAIDCYQLMPNHLHLIILIKGDFEVRAIDEPPNTHHRQFLPQIIGYLKMNSAKEIRENSLLTTPKVWLRNYYEHIIRNKKELLSFRLYIKNNSQNWYFSRQK